MRRKDMKFKEIYSAMKELAKDGNVFFQNAVIEFENAKEEEKESMREWLEDEFADYDPELWNIKDCLLCMSFAE